ncbi:hypothetical protein HELRODRAFT_165415 [Helobdella robusta]|uniref:ISXO2-like transposase domain-containing protein n=1 Tax=Helobdella robusta TaxID=6412 RepID=T1EWR2_HELRO|nr:hypothetical protein HELRODRAFT_165415 [Helobdella robusta]ESN91386.1 hypothetical protein HELRODRAFT_165415 [Helobdella robusta]
MAVYSSVEGIKMVELIGCILNTEDDFSQKAQQRRMATCGGVKTPGAAPQKQLGMEVRIFWSMNDVSQAMVAGLLDLNVGNTLPDWFNLHRDLCMDWARDNPAQIGKTVWTGQWAAYNRITTVTGLNHQTVNHFITFRAVNGVHTNEVENLWRCAKQKFKKMNGTCDAHIQSYLDEFMWLCTIGDKKKERF